MKSPTSVLIIGAGISGLSLAYRLQKQGVDVQLLDAGIYPGGWARTLHTDWGLLEAGPRGLRLRGEGGVAFLELVRELSIESKLIGSDPAAGSRHVFLDGSLESVETKPWKWPFSRATKGLGLALLKEVLSNPVSTKLFDFNQKKQASLGKEDVSVETFLCDRFGKDLYRRLFEPALLGVFGAKGSLLSAATCLTPFWQAYQNSGSVIRGLFAESISKIREKRQNLGSWDQYPLVSFEKGLQDLVDALFDEVYPLFHSKQRVTKIQWDESRRFFQVHSNTQIWLAEKLVVAANPWSLGSDCLDLSSWKHLQNYAQPHSLSLLHMGFEKPLKKEWGFGYLVAPTPEHSLLGVVMDSNIFPQHDRSGFARMTAMMPCPLSGERVEILAGKALSSLQKQLGFDEVPSFTRCSLANQAFALYRPGFEQSRQFLKEEVQNKKWPIEFIGTGYGSFSFIQCLLEAKKLSERFLSN